MRDLPKLTLAVVVHESEPPDRAPVGDACDARVRLEVFCKHHLGDDAGTVEARSLGVLGPTRIRFGDADAVAHQVREVLQDHADQLTRAFLTHRALADALPRPPRMADMPMEVDLDSALATSIGEQPHPADVRYPELGDRRIRAE